MTNVWGERFAAICTLLFAGYMGYMAWWFPVGGHMFPVFVTACMGLLALGMLVMSFVKADQYDQSLDFSITFDDLKPPIFAGLIVLYFVAIFRIGYFTSTFLFLLITPFILGLRRPVFTILTVVLSIVFIYLIFEMALAARLPRGILF